METLERGPAKLGELGISPRLQNIVIWVAGGAGNKEVSGPGLKHTPALVPKRGRGPEGLKRSVVGKQLRSGAGWCHWEWIVGGGQEAGCPGGGRCRLTSCQGAGHLIGGTEDGKEVSEATKATPDSGTLNTYRH